MKKNERITSENIIRHHLKKLGYKVLSIEFVEPMTYEDGTSGNWEANVETDKEIVWN